MAKAAAVVMGYVEGVAAAQPAAEEAQTAAAAARAAGLAAAATANLVEAKAVWEVMGSEAPLAAVVTAAKAAATAAERCEHSSQTIQGTTLCRSCSEFLAQ